MDNTEQDFRERIVEIHQFIFDEESQKKLEVSIDAHRFTTNRININHTHNCDISDYIS